MLACRLLGHRYRFRASGRTMTWTCRRCGFAGGAKDYDSPADAERYARAFDREDRADLGRRAPFVALFPLRLWRLVRVRRGSALDEVDEASPSRSGRSSRPRER